MSGLHVELHTALVDNPLLLPGIGLASRIRCVEVIPGGQLPTLETDELFAYLCVHGASSGWFRLKWLADLAALISRLQPCEITRLFCRSRELGAGRAADLALLLCSRVLGTKLQSELLRSLEAQPVNRWLAAASLRLMRGRTIEAELDQVAWGTVLIHLIQVGLLPGWAFKYLELKRQLTVALATGRM